MIKKDENVDLFSHAIVLLKFMEEEYIHIRMETPKVF